MFAMQDRSWDILAGRDLSASHTLFIRIPEWSASSFDLPHCCGLHLSSGQHGSKTAVYPDCLAGDPRVRRIQ